MPSCPNDPWVSTNYDWTNEDTPVTNACTFDDGSTASTDDQCLCAGGDRESAGTLVGKSAKCSKGEYCTKGRKGVGSNNGGNGICSLGPKMTCPTLGLTKAQRAAGVDLCEAASRQSALGWDGTATTSKAMCTQAATNSVWSVTTAKWSPPEAKQPDAFHGTKTDYMKTGSPPFVIKHDTPADASSDLPESNNHGTPNHRR